MSDFELLRAYAERQAEDAFAQLVNRHVHLVYSAALRQTRAPEEAEEIAQSVFIILARKAATIRPHTVLAAWLLRTTRFTAANARRREQRRRQTEQAAISHMEHSKPDAAWKEIAPLLDEALVRLGKRDQAAIVLRFFEGLSFPEIAGVLGISEASARKRVSRSVEKLRGRLSRMGVAVPAALLLAGLSAYAVQAAPASLAGLILSAASKAALPTGALPDLVAGTLRDLRRVHVAKAAAVGGVALLVVSAALILLYPYGAAASRAGSSSGGAEAAAPAGPVTPRPTLALAAATRANPNSGTTATVAQSAESRATPPSSSVPAKNSVQILNPISPASRFGSGTAAAPTAVLPKRTGDPGALLGPTATHPPPSRRAILGFRYSAPRSDPGPARLIPSQPSSTPLTTLIDPPRPVPEPNTLLLLICATAMLACRQSHNRQVGVRPNN